MNYCMPLYEPTATQIDLGNASPRWKRQVALQARPKPIRIDPAIQRASHPPKHGSLNSRIRHSHTVNTGISASGPVKPMEAVIRVVHHWEVGTPAPDYQHNQFDTICGHANRQNNMLQSFEASYLLGCVICGIYRHTYSKSINNSTPTSRAPTSPG